MLITCPKCENGTVNGVSCTACGGDGEVELTDFNFREFAESDFRAICGTIWTEIFSQLDDIKDKVEDIFEKVNE